MNLEALLGLLQGQDLGQLAEQVGGNEGQVKNGVMAALPAMLTALSKNTGTEKGAQEARHQMLQMQFHSQADWIQMEA